MAVDLGTPPSAPRCGRRSPALDRISTPRCRQTGDGTAPKLRPRGKIGGGNVPVGCQPPMNAKRRRRASKKERKKFSSERMNNVQQQEVRKYVNESHVSIQKGLFIPPLKKCYTCCSPGKFHCPFCLPVYFKPTKLCRVRLHLSKHLNKAFFVGEYTIHRCGQGCRRRQHYHCLYCSATLIRSRDFNNHLPLCSQAQQLRTQKSPQLQEEMTQRVQTKGRSAPSLTTGEIDFRSYEQESDDSDNITINPDSDDQSSQEACAEPHSSKCDQTVQTNIEKPQDCDEFYFMNLVKLFKKLSPKKKAEVRLKIERVLFEAEFD
ncbi:uncharacterized protein LOC130173622 isoform X1 [Seriola aureovittata]|uniref:uncharacterized protein LOC130173622 isoform X1 n=1 Tax=Seriola aureovittata TaxID=2871759 RepID=UPI0024BE8E50|nr:uncharacterized protein LOC130173622 isoform X1 [Seriola aureovittata]